jgi:hypothetical protein
LLGSNNWLRRKYVSHRGHREHRGEQNQER